MHRERQRRERRKTVLFPGCLLTSTPEMPVELLLYSLNERGVEKTRSQKALFAPAASLKDEENAARAPKARAKEIIGLFLKLCARKTLKNAPKKVAVLHRKRT